MRRLDPNLLLAVATTLATGLLVMTATVFEPADPWWRYVLTALVIVAAYIALQPVAQRITKANQPPMILRESPQTAIWAAVYPGVIILLAALPLLFPGVGFGIAVVVAGVFTGATIRSAMTSRSRGY